MERSPGQPVDRPSRSSASVDLTVSLLTGGADRPYNLGLLQALVDRGVHVDFVANDEMADADVIRHPLVTFLNLRGSQRADVSLLSKVFRILKYYVALARYASRTSSRLFHIQWYNKFVYLDRVALNLYYKFLGKKLIFTAHNINDRERDGNDTLLNRLTLRWSYRLFDHIFVHTQKMKEQLHTEFGVRNDKVTVIPFGINSTNRITDLTREQARARLGLSSGHKVLLFFGNIAPYKGVEFLLRALPPLIREWPELRVVLAGRVKECPEYWREMQGLIRTLTLEKHIVQKIDYIPDDDVEIYFKAADALVLPYTFVFQSGVAFLGYNFGLPVIASNVGDLESDVVEGETGYIFERESSEDLAQKIATFFRSDLFRDLDHHRPEIIRTAREKHSWDEVGRITRQVYERLLATP